MEDFDFILLLHKRFTGEIKAGESTQLDAWIGQSAEHAELAKEYQQVWQGTSEQRKDFQLNMDAEYQHLLTRLDADARPSFRVVFRRKAFLRIAAAVVFLVAATWGYRQYTQPELQKIQVENLVYNSKQLVTLPDGSKVWLRQQASLEFPKVFSNSERRVKLIGEAYFDVAHRPEQPFRVELDEGGLVEVLGTQFNVRSEPQSTETSIVVREGKVRYLPNGKGAGAILTARDKAVYRRDAPAQIVVSKVLTFNELAWQTNQLEFVATPLRQVLSDLENHYHVKMELRNPALFDCRYTALLNDQPLDTVLESLVLIFRLKVSQPTAGRYLLNGGTCK